MYTKNIRMNQPTPWVIQKPKVTKKAKEKLNTQATKLFFPGQANMGRTLAGEKNFKTYGVPGKK